MYARTLLLFTCWASFVFAYDVTRLVQQIPGCVRPCLLKILQKTCGSSTDWVCGCSPGGISYGALYSNACINAEYSCSASQLDDALLTVEQICSYPHPTVSGATGPGSNMTGGGGGSSNGGGGGSSNGGGGGSSNGGGGGIVTGGVGNPNTASSLSNGIFYAAAFSAAATMSCIVLECL